MFIDTNRLDVQFDVNAINRDFAFIRLERQGRNGKWNGAKMLDSFLGDQFKALSVLYRYGRFAYVMFRRPMDTYGLINRIRSHPDFADFDDGAVTAAEASELRNADDPVICEAWLLQILLNSLASSKSKKYPELNFCNLTGNLTLLSGGRKKLNNTLKCFEVSLSPSFLMEISGTLYRKKVALLHEMKHCEDLKRRETLTKKLKGPHYEPYGGKGILRRSLPGDSQSYIRCGEYGKRENTAFLDTSNWDNFVESRSAILYKTLKRAQEELSDYVKIAFSGREIDRVRSISCKNMNAKDYLKGALGNWPIHIVDKVKSPESLELTANLRENISLQYSDLPITTGDWERKEAINFRIIHSLAHYQQQSTKDEYLPSDGEVVRQNLTLEAMLDEKGTVSDVSIKTAIKEGAIKRDILLGRISLFDWRSLNSREDWTFGTLDGSEGRFMIVHPDGTFEIKTENMELNQDGELQRYIGLMQTADREGWKNEVKFEGLVAQGDSVNLISRSNEITLPDLEGIFQTMEKVGSPLPEGKDTGIALLPLLEDFIKAYPPAMGEKDGPKVAQFRDDLKGKGTSPLSKKTLKVMINECLGANTNLGRAFKEHLKEGYGIEFYFPRGKGSVEKHLQAMVEIKYFQESDKTAGYFVGDRKSGLKESLKRAHHLRKVQATEGSKLIVPDLLPTMDVDFVRTGQSTV
ncbi:MAG: hypothetical protein EOM17_11955, partial [Synergistales bacterium]|nr:hypothetical protein [Synergistales bacterium]